MDATTTTLSAVQFASDLLFGVAKMIHTFHEEKQDEKRVSYINGDLVGDDSIVLSFHSKARDEHSKVIVLKFDADVKGLEEHLTGADDKNSKKNEKNAAKNVIVNAKIAKLEEFLQKLREPCNHDNGVIYQAVVSEIAALKTTRLEELDVRDKAEFKDPEKKKALFTSYSRANFLESNEMESIKVFFLAKAMDEHFEYGIEKILQDLKLRNFDIVSIHQDKQLQFEYHGDKKKSHFLTELKKPTEKYTITIKNNNYKKSDFKRNVRKID